MRRLLMFCLFAISQVSTAVAADFILWMETTKPSDKVLNKAQRVAGVKEHLFYRDLAFPPQPFEDADQRKLADVTGYVNDALLKWEDFDVELGIARKFSTYISGVDVIRDVDDLEAVVKARLLQGAAIYRAYDPQRTSTIRPQVPAF